MAAAALGIAIVAVLVSIATAAHAAHVARELGGSGFKAEEQLKTDLVNLLSALRGLTAKGALAGDNGVYRQVNEELTVIRSFASSTSGFGLMALAAQRGREGASDDENAGRWRTLSLNLGNLAGAQPARAADNLSLRLLATDVELTLEDLTSDDIRAICRMLRDLPAVFDTLRETRSKDILLRAWFEIHAEQAEASNPRVLRPRLEALRAAGHKDPDIDFWLALLDGDVAAMKHAVERGADRTTSITAVVERYADGSAGAMPSRS
jgi:hypothetical protein